MEQRFVVASKMEQRFLANPYDDYNGQQSVEVDKERIQNLIRSYVGDIVKHTREAPSRGELYVGDAGKSMRN